VPEETASARHWLWVAGPDYYLDESQKERPDLESAAGFSPSAWWTCSSQTRAGDTVLPYRSKTKKHIAHFLVVRSDAEPLDLPGDPFHGKHVCQYEVIERLRTRYHGTRSRPTTCSETGMPSRHASSSPPSRCPTIAGVS
jgi:hypothetical protein